MNFRKVFFLTLLVFVDVLFLFQLFRYGSGSYPAALSLIAVASLATLGSFLQYTFTKSLSLFFLFVFAVLTILAGVETGDLVFYCMAVDYIVLFLLVSTPATSTVEKQFNEGELSLHEVNLEREREVGISNL
jgi:hypothetical protein